MKVTMIGAGHVGLVSGACSSNFGHEVIVVDTDQSPSTSPAWPSWPRATRW